MLVTALHLGLRPHETVQRGVPQQKVATDFPDETLPDDHVSRAFLSSLASW